jgi:hypothetical protein
MPRRGERMSDEAKARLSEAKRLMWADPESKYNSPELRAKWSAQRAGVAASPTAVAKRVAKNRGKKRTPDQLARMSERWTPEARLARSEALRGQWNGQPAKGCHVERKRYRKLTGQYDHPLAVGGRIYEHRKVLYDKIGPGPHLCHWRCGRLVNWGGTKGLHTDHVDGVRTNNDPDNLVPACPSCNKLRAKAGNPLKWAAPC